MNPLTCQASVHAASDQLAVLPPDAERGALKDHLAGWESCSYLMDQLRSTVAVLGSRPEVAYGAVVDAALAELKPSRNSGSIFRGQRKAVWRNRLRGEDVVTHNPAYPTWTIASKSRSSWHRVVSLRWPSVVWSSRAPDSRGM